MKKLFLLALLALGTALAVEQPFLSRGIIAREPLQIAAQSRAEWPDADVLLVENRIGLRYEADGTYLYTSDSAFKIVTEKGRQEKSTITIGYSSSYGKARFVKAEIIRPDGSVIPVDIETQSRESIDQGQMDANIYDPSHKTVQLTVPGLGIGDVLRYTVSGERVKTVVPGTWSDIFTLEATHPILYAIYEIDAPASCPLVKTVLRDEIPGTVTFREQKENDRIRYTWEARNVPRMFEEPGMPSSHTVVQRLLLSTIPDWESLSTWYWELSKPRLDHINPTMRQKVRELTGDLSGRQEKIDALFRFVSQDIRYMGITIEDEAPGYEPHDVSLTFNNRYGVCRDKAALLVSMLRLAGLDARPVLIYVGPKKDPDVPQPWFNHAITGVRNDDGSWLLMDPTNENTRDLLPAYLSNCSYLVAAPEGATLQTSAVVPPEENLLTIEVDASLDETRRITARAAISFNGINDTSYRGRLAALKPDERHPYFEDLLKQALGPARLTRLEIRPDRVRDTSLPLSVALDFEIDQALASGPDTALLQIPTLINHFGLFGRVLGDGIGLEKRRYPLNTRVTCGISETVRLDLSRSGLRPASLPAYDLIDTPELAIRRDVTDSGDGVLVSQAEILLRTVEFDPDQYLTLKKNLQASERNARKRIILEPAGFPSGADLVTLSETVDYTLYDASNWREDRMIQQQVLTYAGKKQLSDLRFTYNPSVQRIAISSATVTSPGGKVQHLDPGKEINIMDDKWTGDAPRYPAGKIMVASLPGVEVGSIIEYRVITVHRGLPFFSAEETFSGLNPVLSKTVRVEMPHALNLNINSTDPFFIRRRTAHRHNSIIHEWSAQSRRMIRKEDRLPPDRILMPALMLSCSDPKSYASTVEKALTGAARDNKVSAAKARELTRGLKTRTEKITVLNHFVDRSVRAAGPAFSALPLSAVTPADQILAEGYGNTTDRAVLLYAMLDAAGLNPRFILSSGLTAIQGFRDPAVDTLQRAIFDTVLVAAVNDRKQTVYLGDGSQYSETGALAREGHPAIDLKTGRIEIPQSIFPAADGTVFTMELTEEGDVSLIRKAVFSGTEFEKFHRQFVLFTPEERRRAHQNLLSRISQFAEMTGELETSFEHPGELRFSTRLPGYAVREGDRMYFSLPEGLGNLLGLKSSRRENPFYIEKPVRRTFLYEIALPEGWKAVLLPESFREELPSGGGFVDVKISAEKDRLIILQQASLNPSIILAEEYPVLMQIHSRLTGPSARNILLQRTGL